jgi:hypothetical protein
MQLMLGYITWNSSNALLIIQYCLLPRLSAGYSDYLDNRYNLDVITNNAQTQCFIVQSERQIKQNQSLSMKGKIRRIMSMFNSFIA